MAITSIPQDDEDWSDVEEATLANDQTGQLERGAQCLPVADLEGFVGEPTNGAEYLAMIQQV